MCIWFHFLRNQQEFFIMMLINKKLILVLAIGFILPTVVKAKEKLIKSVAFGSCLKQTRPQPIWDSVLLAKPDVFVLLGDNIYGDTRDMEKLKNKWLSLIHI